MNDLCNNVAMQCNISKAQHAMNEPYSHIYIFFQEEGEKGPWLYSIWEERGRGYGGHIHQWPVTDDAVSIQEIWKEKNVKLFTFWLKISFSSPIFIWVFKYFQWTKNRSWGDKLKIDCNILSNDPQKYNSLSEIYKCCLNQEPYNFRNNGNSPF